LLEKTVLVVIKENREQDSKVTRVLTEQTECKVLLDLKDSKAKMDILAIKVLSEFLEEMGNKDPLADKENVALADFTDLKVSKDPLALLDKTDILEKMDLSDQKVILESTENEVPRENKDPLELQDHLANLANEDLKESLEMTEIMEQMDLREIKERLDLLASATVTLEDVLCLLPTAQFLVHNRYSAN